MLLWHLCQVFDCPATRPPASHCRRRILRLPNHFNYCRSLGHWWTGKPRTAASRLGVGRCQCKPVFSLLPHVGPCKATRQVRFQHPPECGDSNSICSTLCSECKWGTASLLWHGSRLSAACEDDIAVSNALDEDFTMRIPIREQLGLLVLLTSLTALAVIAIATWITNYNFVLGIR